MSRKRSSSENEGGDVLVDIRMAMDTNNRVDQQPSFSAHSHKRCCGTASNPAPGELHPDEVSTYLHSLSSHLNNSQLEHARKVLSTEGWKAFAELNILLESCLVSGAPTDKLLRSYSRFTVQARDRLWHHYSKYAADKASLTTQQLELLRFLLECVLAPFSDCALTEVTLDLPPWMVSWASRWGMASSNNRIKLIRLEAYTPMDPCSSSVSAPRQPVRVLYVPALE